MEYNEQQKSKIDQKIDLIKKCLLNFDINFYFEKMPKKIKGLSIVQNDIKIIVINSCFRWNYKRIEEIARHEFCHILHPDTMYNLNDGAKLIIKREKDRHTLESEFYKQLNNVNIKSAVSG
jgi:hypothetical protein